MPMTIIIKDITSSSQLMMGKESSYTKEVAMLDADCTEGRLMAALTGRETFVFQGNTWKVTEKKMDFDNNVITLYVKKDR